MGHQPKYLTSQLKSINADGTLCFKNQAVGLLLSLGGVQEVVMSPSGPRPFHRLFEEQVERALQRQLATEKRGPAAEPTVF